MPVYKWFKEGVSHNIYCVNIDAVIAAISLKLMWNSYKENRISHKEIQEIGFYIFLIGRITGVSTEIIDLR